MVLYAPSRATGAAGPPAHLDGPHKVEEGAGCARGPQQGQRPVQSGTQTTLNFPYGSVAKSWQPRAERTKGARVPRVADQLVLPARAHSPSAR